MDPNTGKLYENVPADEAKARGLITVPAAEHARVLGMTRLERRKWAADSEGVPLVLTNAEQHRVDAAVAKRERKAARRAAEAKGTRP
jgi:hypothetical protein